MIENILYDDGTMLTTKKMYWEYFLDIKHLSEGIKYIEMCNFIEHLFDITVSLSGFFYTNIFYFTNIKRIVRTFCSFNFIPIGSAKYVPETF